MIKNLLSLALALLLASPLWAQDLAEQVEESVEDAQEQVQVAEDMAEDRAGSREDFTSHMYIVGKVFTSPGQDYDHGGHTITGDTATGFGLDLGYKLGDHWAVELAYSAGSGSVKAHQSSLPLLASSSPSSVDASYNALGLLGVYTAHLGESFSLVGKLGGVSESEDLGEAGGSSSATGLVYVLGCEYKLFGHNELVLEYEDTTIDGPRAYTLFLGFKHGFGH